jgi:hypothetical protein
VKTLWQHGEDVVNATGPALPWTGSANSFAAVACQDYGATPAFPLESAAAIMGKHLFLAAKESGNA